MRGITFYVCFGKPSWPHVRITAIEFMVCLGIVSFCIVLLDIEMVSNRIAEVIDKQRKEIDKFKSIVREREK